MLIHELLSQIDALFSAESLLKNEELFAIYKEYAKKSFVQESIDFLDAWQKLDKLHTRLEANRKRFNELTQIQKRNNEENTELTILSETITTIEQNMQVFMCEIYGNLIDDTANTENKLNDEYQRVKINLDINDASKIVRDRLKAEAQNNHFNFSTFEATKNVIINLLQNDDFKRFVKTDHNFKNFTRKIIMELIIANANELIAKPQALIENFQRDLKTIEVNKESLHVKELKKILNSKSIANVKQAILDLNMFMQNPIENLALTKLQDLNVGDYTQKLSEIKELLKHETDKNEFLNMLKDIETKIEAEYQKLHGSKKNKEATELLNILNSLLLGLGIHWRETLISICQAKLYEATQIINNGNILGSQDTRNILASINKCQDAITYLIDHLTQLKEHENLPFKWLQSNFSVWVLHCNNIIDRERECQKLYLTKKHKREDSTKIKSQVKKKTSVSKHAQSVKHKRSNNRINELNVKDFIDLVDQIEQLYVELFRSKSIASQRERSQTNSNNNTKNINALNISTNQPLSRIKEPSAEYGRNRAATEISSPETTPSINTQSIHVLNACASEPLIEFDKCQTNIASLNSPANTNNNVNNINAYNNDGSGSSNQKKLDDPADGKSDVIILSNDFNQILTSYNNNSFIPSGSVQIESNNNTRHQNADFSQTKYLLHAHRRHSMSSLDQTEHPSILQSLTPRGSKQNTGSKNFYKSKS